MGNVPAPFSNMGKRANGSPPIWVSGNMYRRHLLSRNGMVGPTSQGRLSAYPAGLKSCRRQTLHRFLLLVLTGSRKRDAGSGVVDGCPPLWESQEGFGFHLLMIFRCLKAGRCCIW